MKHLKKFALSGVVVAVLLMSVLPAYGQSVQDTPENRRIAAERYLAAVPPDELIADSIRELAARMPKGQRDEFARLMRELIRPDRIRQMMVEAMIRRFTAQELDALAGFYDSEIGRSIAKKFGVYTADIQPHIQAEFSRVLKELEIKSRSR